MAELTPGMLACGQCDALVHAEELEQLATAAQGLEAGGQLRPAREQWLKASELLPPTSQQTAWIRNHARELLGAAMESEARQSEKSSTWVNKWAKTLGPLGGIALLLWKGKAILTAVLKLNFLFSLGAFLGFYWTLFGAKFGVGFALLVLIHEMGHFVDIKRRGLPAEMPVFLPGLGAYVRWQALGVSAETRAAVSLAGPLAGWVAAAVCLLLWWRTGDNLWGALARSGAWLNVLNLTPVWVLDGGQAAEVLGRSHRLWLLAAGTVLWIGLGEGVFFLIVAGAVYRLFSKDMPERSSYSTAVYYVALLVLLGFVLRMVPGHGFDIG